MAMRESAIRRMVEDLEKQGCTVRDTKSGWMVYFPDGITMMGVHRSKPQNSNTEKVWRRKIEGGGLQWPDFL